VGGGKPVRWILGEGCDGLLYPALGAGPQWPD
jgi:hypothetical protein